MGVKQNLIDGWNKFGQYTSLGDFSKLVVNKTLKCNVTTQGFNVTYNATACNVDEIEKLVFDFNMTLFDMRKSSRFATTFTPYTSLEEVRVLCKNYSLNCTNFT